MSKDRVAEYLVKYAEMVNAPIREGVEVLKAERMPGEGGFRVETSQGMVEARRIVTGTGITESGSDSLMLKEVQLPLGFVTK